MALGSKRAAPGSPAADTPGGDSQKLLQVEIHQPEPTAVQLAERIVTPVVEPLSTTAIVLIVSIFILLQREDLRDRMIRLFGSSDLHRTTVAMNDAARRLSRYLLIQFTVNASFGLIITVGLAILGIPSAMVWGVLGAMLRFVPYVGAPFAALMPMALAAGIDPGWSLLLWTAALYAVVELILGQAIEPQLYGRGTRAVAVRGGRRGNVLDLAVGAHRFGALHAADIVSGGTRAACAAIGVPRSRIGRPARADAGGELLPANARG